MFASEGVIVQPNLTEERVPLGEFDYIFSLPGTRKVKDLALLRLSGETVGEKGTQIFETASGELVITSEIDNLYGRRPLPGGLIIEVPLLERVNENFFTELRGFLVGRLSKGGNRTVWLVETRPDNPGSEEILQNKKLMGQLGFVKPELIEVARIRKRIVYWGGLQRQGQRENWPTAFTRERTPVVCGDCGEIMDRDRRGICSCPHCSIFD